MSRCVERLTAALATAAPAAALATAAPAAALATAAPPAAALATAAPAAAAQSDSRSCFQQLADIQQLLSSPVFRRLMTVHNTIQLVECFQCPPPALCTDARDLVQEVKCIPIGPFWIQGLFLLARLKG
jgi:hypothetical protein